MHQSPTFAQLLSSAPILRALERKGYTHPTPIQAGSIPPVLAGHDLLGLAQTGTGKTAAFALPVLQRLAERAPAAPAQGGRQNNSRGGTLPRCLVLTPTRELCVQVAESFKAYGEDLPLRMAQIFGGVGEEPQRQALRRGVDIIVATPGRLLDLLNQGSVSLNNVEVLVLDEADRMLDMGFLPDVKRIVAHVPKERQTLLFSATMPPEISGIAAQWLRNPKRVEVAPVSSTPERIDQAVYFIEKGGKPVLLRSVVESEGAQRVLVFSRTKHGADRICRTLEKQRMSAFAIHGNKSQGARQKALLAFRDGEVRVLVATDLAARGIDVKGIDLVINYDLPNEPETYVHRIGRTARAGAEGRALSFCSREERPYLRSIERLTQIPVAVRAIPEGLEQLAAGIADHEADEERRDSAHLASASRPRRSNGTRAFQPRQSSSGVSNPRTEASGNQGGNNRPDYRSDNRSSHGASGGSSGSRGGNNRPHAEPRRDSREGGRERSWSSEGSQGGRRGGRSQGPSSASSSQGSRDGYRGDRQGEASGNSRHGHARGPARSSQAKPEVHHENKAPLWTRLVNHFTGKPDEATREGNRR